MPKPRKKPGSLTPKQAAFCAEYLIDLNGCQAAIRAGYSKKTARSVAAENLTKPDIQAEVARLMGDRSRRVEVTADNVLAELLKIAMADIGQAFKEDGSLKTLHDMPEEIRRAIAGVDVFEEFEGRGEDREQIGFTKKVRFWDKTKALEMLGRHLRMFTDKMEHSVPGGIAVGGVAPLTPEGQKDMAATLAAVHASLNIPEGLKPLGK